MMITVVALVCHQVVGLSSPVCHEEIVVQDEMSMQVCMLAIPAVAEWKNQSKFSGDQWTIAKVRCIPGDYQPKDAV